jgi:hypothetical protein
VTRSGARARQTALGLWLRNQPIKWNLDTAVDASAITRTAQALQCIGKRGILLRIEVRQARLDFEVPGLLLQIVRILFEFRAGMVPPRQALAGRRDGLSQRRELRTQQAIENLALGYRDVAGHADLAGDAAASADLCRRIDRGCGSAGFLGSFGIVCTFRIQLVQQRGRIQDFSDQVPGRHAGMELRRLLDPRLPGRLLRFVLLAHAMLLC